jgi:uncharacterized membrane protein YoaK (UPF0700 family)
MKLKTRKIIGIILQAPLILVVIVSFAISIYAAHNKISGITYGSSIITGLIISLYFLGIFLVIKKDKKN